VTTSTRLLVISAQPEGLKSVIAIPVSPIRFLRFEGCDTTPSLLFRQVFSYSFDLARRLNPQKIINGTIFFS